MARISYVKLVKLVMLDQLGQDSYVITVRLVRLDKLFELDQVSYDSYVRLVKVYDILLKMGTDCFIQ